MGNRKGERGVFAGMAGGVSMEALERRELLAAVAWDGGAGTANWADAANWSTDVVPGADDDVTIGATALPAILYTAAAGDRTINSLTAAEALTFTSGSLRVLTTATSTAQVTVTSVGRLVGGQWSVASLSGTGGTLEDVALTGELVVPSGTFNVAGGTTFTLARLTGTSVLNFSAGYVLRSELRAEGTGTCLVTCTGTLRISATGVVSVPAGSTPTLTIGGAGTTLVNEGTITSAAQQRSVLVRAGSVVNTGAMSVTGQGGSLSLEGQWTNSGTMSASGTTSRLEFLGAWSNAGTVNLTNATLRMGGVFSSSGIGTVNRTNSTIDIVGQLNNTGLALSAATGSYRLNGGQIVGGGVTTNGDATLRVVAGTLNNVTVQADLFVDGGGLLDILGTTSFQVARLLDDVTVRFGNGYTLNSTIRSEGTAVGTRNVVVLGGGVLNIGAQGRVEAAGTTTATLVLGDGGTSVVSAGVLEVSGGTLRVDAVAFTSTAGFVTNGGSLTVNGTWTNSGPIVGNTGAIRFNGIWRNTGAVSVTNATLNLGGIFSIEDLVSGGFTRAGGTVNIVGTLVNSVFTLGPELGTWNIGTQLDGTGTIANCTISLTGGAQLLCSGAVISSSTISGDIQVAETGNVDILGTTTFEVLHLSRSSYVRFQSGYTLTSTVRAEGSGVGARSIGGIGQSVLTIGETGLVELAADSAGDLGIGDGDDVIINRGTIVNRSTRALTVGPMSLVNEGTIAAERGTLNMPDEFTNIGVISGTNAIVTLGGLWFNSTVTLGGPWTNLGTIRVVNSALNLSGYMTTAGLGLAGLERTGGTVVLAGQLANSSLTLNASTGSWELFGGQIAGGTLSYADGATLSARFGTFASVAIAGDLFLSDSAQVDVAGTTSFAVAHVPNGARIRFAPGYTLNSTVRFEGPGTLGRSAVTSSTGVLTIGTSGVIEIAPGTLGSVLLGNPTTTLLNFGTVASHATGQSITVAAAVLLNYSAGTLSNGTWIASNGGAIELGAGRTVTTNNATLHVASSTSVIRGATGVLVNRGTMTLGTGVVYATPSFVNSGVLVLGGGSLLSVSGAFSQTASGELRTDLVNATTLGRVSCQGCVLAGSLRVISSSGFDPSNPAMMLFGADIITATSMTGSVALVSQPPLAAGSYVARVTGNRLELLHNIADMNGDGGVDADDVVAFFGLWDSGGIFADVNGDGSVDSDDVILFFSLWDNGGR